MRARRSFDKHRRIVDGPQARLDVCAVREHGEPARGIFPYPRSCFSFRFEGANAVLHSVVKGNEYIPPRIVL
jgi:hypothetical protein